MADMATSRRLKLRDLQNLLHPHPRALTKGQVDDAYVIMSGRAFHRFCRLAPDLDPVFRPGLVARSVGADSG